MEAEANLPNTEDDHQELAATKQDLLHEVTFMADLEKPSMEQPLSIPSASSTWKEEDDDESHEERIKMAKAEMREVKEENERLKKGLDKIIKDYETLKRQFHEIMVQREAKKSTQTSGSCTINDDEEEAAAAAATTAAELEVDDMVSLTLGRFSTDGQNKINTTTTTINVSSTSVDQTTKLLDRQISLDHLKQDYWGRGRGRGRGQGGGSDQLGVVKTTPSIEIDHHILQTPTHSDQPKDEEEAAGETWPPSKALKALPQPPVGEDEVSQQNPPKKARVCVRARCDTPTMNDGCQWRKYGQKIAKGNPCPRAYYRCTGAPSCPVRKQVQRSVDDISILITTYEGTHNHPLPVSAMAMASTTSAAASMLLSGPSSSTSRPGQLNPSSSAAVGAGNLHGMNLYLSNNMTNSKQFYLPNSSMLSSSLNHPTITLDLTSNPPSTSSSSSPFHKIPSITTNYPPKYPFTSSLDFGSSQPNFMSWNNNHNNSSYPNNNNNQQPFNISKNAIGMPSDHLAKQLPLHTNIYQACLQQLTKPSTNSPLPPPPPPPLPDTIAAATKAITSDPSFQSALVAALSSIIGGGGGGETVGPMSSYVQAAQGNVGFQVPAPSLTCSTSKSTPSSSPGDSRDNAK